MAGGFLYGKKTFPYVNGKPDLDGMADFWIDIREKHRRKQREEWDEDIRKKSEFLTSPDEEPYDDPYSMDTSTFDSYKYKKRKR